MARRVIQISASVPGSSDGSRAPQQVFNGFDTTAATIASDLWANLQPILAGLPSGGAIAVSITVLDVVNL